MTSFEDLAAGPAACAPTRHRARGPDTYLVVGTAVPETIGTPLART